MEELNKQHAPKGDIKVYATDEGIKEFNEQNKYYTPKIEEFCYNFPYEQKAVTGGWREMEFSFNLKKIKSYLEQGRIRVKHLDREDIESLGFEYDDKRDEYSKGDIIIDFNNKTHVTIGRYQEDYPMGEHTSWTDDLFIGTIKNKSELKRILKQIGV